LKGEQIFELAPLAVFADAEVTDGEGSRSPAVELFLRAARAARPDFAGSADELADVVAICQALDGLPLAVELAAAQLRYVPLGYIRTHMSVNTALGGDELRDRPAHQNSVTDTVEWSYRLLTPTEQRLLRCLSVLSGAWSLEDAAAVSEVTDSATTLRGVAGLVDKSLVVRADTGATEPGFTMLHVIREYARDRLEEAGEAREIRLRHADHVATVTRDFEQQWWTDLGKAAVADLGKRYPSVLDALEFSFADGDPLVGAAITADLHIWWPRSGYHVDGRRFAALAFNHIEDLDQSVAALLNLCVGMLAFMKRDLSTARHHWQLAVDQTLAEPSGRYHILAICDVAATSIGRPDEFDDALEMAAEGLARARALGEARLLANCLNVYGELSRVGGRLDLAKEAYIEALELNRALGDEQNEAIVEANLGHAATALGDYREALGHSRRALVLSSELGDRVMAAWTISELGLPLLGVGEADRAAFLVGGSESALNVLQAHRGPGDQPSFEQGISALVAELGQERFDELFEAGAAVALDQCAALALETLSDLT
ncbi:MAG: ATP-binding protein, partial [Acidimicrobiales bacterium]